MMVDVSSNSFGTPRAIAAHSLHHCQQKPTARLNLLLLRGLCRNLNWKHDEADDSERLRHELYFGFGPSGPASTILWHPLLRSWLPSPRQCRQAPLTTSKFVPCSCHVLHSATGR